MVEQEHVLVVLWLDEPKALMEHLRSQLPGYKVTYFKQKDMEESLGDGMFLANTGGVPIGKFRVSIPPTNPLTLLISPPTCQLCMGSRGSTY